MTLANGRHYTAIPGPSVVPDRVLQAMHRASPNIYSTESRDLVDSIFPDLKSVARTRHDVAMYVANGHGVWEAAIANVLNPGDTALVLTTGYFGTGWGNTADAIGIKQQVLKFPKQGCIDLEKVAEALVADKDHKIKVVMTVHVDTATSVKNDILGLRKVMDTAGHPALLAVDCIASLGCDRFEMDAWGVDIMVSASQKGLMTPPGMGFLFFNDRADVMRENIQTMSQNLDWRPRRLGNEFYQYFNGTAPTHLLFALRESLTMINEEGLEVAWKRHEVLANCYWSAIDAWGQGGDMRHFIADPQYRSHAVSTVHAGAPHGTALRDWLEANAGITLGVGLDMAPMGDPAWHGYFRIGHMGHVNAHMVLGTIGAIQAGMSALKIPYGAGALDAASKVIALG